MQLPSKDPEDYRVGSPGWRPPPDQAPNDSRRAADAEVLRLNLALGAQGPTYAYYTSVEVTPGVWAVAFEDGAPVPGWRGWITRFNRALTDARIDTPGSP